MFKIRYLKENEKSFLMEMLYESIYIKKEAKPSIDELLNSDELRKYHEDWGREGDKALLVVDDKDIPVGAAWYRLFSYKEPGYGYINANTPEVGIAIKEEARRKGLGTKLIQLIIEEAKNNGFKALSLSVALNNTNAINLYRKFGFVEISKTENTITMLLK
ncbi:N-acetyltransferase family protein [Metabacillus fastidiosus]|uniref:GNAT family N-acetyltransferase n=2 Tax=Metabacillus fastidiosus TaxID=1458 RepID=UPI003D27E5E2